MTEQRATSLDYLAFNLAKPYTIITQTEQTIVKIPTYNCDVHIDNLGYYHVKINGHWKLFADLEKLLKELEK